MHSFSLPHPVQCQEMRKCLITLFDQQTRYFRSTWKSIDTTLSSKSLSNISQNDTPPQTRIMLHTAETSPVQFHQQILSDPWRVEAPMFASYHYQGLAWKFQTDTGSHPLQKTPRVLKCELEFWKVWVEKMSLWLQTGLPKTSKNMAYWIIVERIHFGGSSTTTALISGWKNVEVP